MLVQIQNEIICNNRVPCREESNKTTNQVLFHEESLL